MRVFNVVDVMLAPVMSGLPVRKSPALPPMELMKSQANEVLLELIV